MVPQSLGPVTFEFFGDIVIFAILGIATRWHKGVSDMKKLISMVCAAGFVLGFGSVAMADGDEDDRRIVEHSYVLLAGGNGDGSGFCEFERRGKRVWARVWVAGARNNGFVTAWKTLNGETTRLDGTVATGTGDAELTGHFRIKRGTTEVTLDARGHYSTIQMIDSNVDLNTELTSPNGLNVQASEMLGTCSASFNRGGGHD